MAPIVKGRKGHYRELFESLAKKGIYLCAHRRRDPRNIVRHASRPLQDTHHRPGGRPPRGQRRVARPADDLPEGVDAAGQGHDGRLTTTAPSSSASIAPPDVPLDGRGLRGPRAAYLFVQLAAGRLSPLQRSGRGGGVRRGEDHSRHEAFAARRGRRATGQVPQQHAFRHPRNAGPPL